MIRAALLTLALAAPAQARGLPDYLTGDPFGGALADAALVAYQQDCLARRLDYGPERCILPQDENACFRDGLDFDGWSRCYLVEAASWDRVVQDAYAEALGTARDHDASAGARGGFAGAEVALIAAQQAFETARLAVCREQWASQAGWDNGPSRNYAICMVWMTALRAHQLYAWGKI